MKKKKRIYCGLLAVISCLLLIVLVMGRNRSQTEKRYTIRAPGRDMQAEFWLDEEGIPWYQIKAQGQSLINASKLGIVTSFADLDAGFLLRSAEESFENMSWRPLVGEQSEINSCYNQMTFFMEQQENGSELGIEIRVYDEGAAIRYLLPKTKEEYRILEESTCFVFPEGTVANAYPYSNQTVPVKVDLSTFSEEVFTRPVTMQYPNGKLLTICEADLDNYSAMKLVKDSGQDQCLKIHHGKVIVTSEGPYETPWRTMVIADEETDLLENASVVMNLNEPAEEDIYQYSDWVDPGTAVMLCGTMTTESVKEQIDKAAAHGIRYILLDSGWYGPEQDPVCDPRLDPDKVSKDSILNAYLASEGGYENTGEGVFSSGEKGFSMYGNLGETGDCLTELDIPEVCDYGKSRQVGIILYVNGIFLPDDSAEESRFTADELFSYFEKWGVAGVKPGFVDVDSQTAEQYLEEEVIKSAAAHKLILTIHDEYVTTGIERTYPHILAVEGILGDEGIGIDTPQAAEDIASAFIRCVQAPADHTFCYPGKATKAYALASPIVFRSGISMLYWYTDPDDIPKQDQGKMQIWDHLPQTWEKSLYLEGKMYEYVTVARESLAGEWYLGSLSAVERQLEIPLDFLEEDTIYVADIYADGQDADPYEGRSLGGYSKKSDQVLENEKYLVTSETVLTRKLNYGFGYAVKLTKAGNADMNLPKY